MKPINNLHVFYANVEMEIKNIALHLEGGSLQLSQSLSSHNIVHCRTNKFIDIIHPMPCHKLELTTRGGNHHSHLKTKKDWRQGTQQNLHSHKAYTQSNMGVLTINTMSLMWFGSPIHKELERHRGHPDHKGILHRR